MATTAFPELSTVRKNGRKRGNRWGWSEDFLAAHLESFRTDPTPFDISCQAWEAYGKGDPSAVLVLEREGNLWERPPHIGTTPGTLAY